MSLAQEECHLLELSIQLATPFFLFLITIYLKLQNRGLTGAGSQSQLGDAICSPTLRTEKMYCIL